MIFKFLKPCTKQIQKIQAQHKSKNLSKCMKLVMNDASAMCIPLIQVHGDKIPNKLKITQVIVQIKAMGDTMGEIPTPSLSKKPRRGYQDHNHLDPCL